MFDVWEQIPADFGIHGLKLTAIVRRMGLCHFGWAGNMVHLISAGERGNMKDFIVTGFLEVNHMGFMHIRVLDLIFNDHLVTALALCGGVRLSQATPILVWYTIIKKISFSVALSL